MQLLTKKIIGVMGVILVLMMAAGFALAEKKQNATDKVAVVNGTVVGKKDFDRQMQVLNRRLAGSGQTPSEAKMNELRQAVLDRMIDTELLYQKAAEQGYLAEDGKVTEEVGRIRSRFPGEEEYADALAGMGISESELREQIRQGLTIQKFLSEKFEGKAEVSEAEAKLFYEENQAEFKQPESVRASHILVKVEAGADETTKKAAREELEGIRKQVEDGGDFAELAREKSEGPSASKGGDLGYFSRGQMVPAFEEAAFALEPGQLSDIVETRFGYHLIRIKDKKPAGTVSFADAEEEIKQFLKQQKMQEMLDSYLAEVKKNSTIEIFLGEAG